MKRSKFDWWSFPCLWMATCAEQCKKHTWRWWRWSRTSDHWSLIIHKAWNLSADSSWWRHLSSGTVACCICGIQLRSFHDARDKHASSWNLMTSKATLWEPSGVGHCRSSRPASTLLHRSTLDMMFPKQVGTGTRVLVAPNNGSFLDFVVFVVVVAYVCTFDTELLSNLWSDLGQARETFTSYIVPPRGKRSAAHKIHVHHWSSIWCYY